MHDALDTLGHELLELLPSLSIDVQTHIASDDSVEGMLRITGVPRNEAMRGVVMDLEMAFIDYFDVIPYPIARLWFWLSLHYQAPEGVKTADTRYRGLSVARTNSSRAIRGKFVVPFLGGLRIIANLKRKRRLKPVALYLWLFWSPIGWRPDPKNMPNQP